MERTKAPKAVLTGAEWEDLVKLQEFVQTASEADLGAVCSSACIYTSTTSDSISGKFATMRIDLPDTQISMSFRFGSHDAILLVFQAIVGSPTLTHLSIVILDSIVEEVFAVVGTSRRLSTLDITCTGVSDHVKAIARCFSGNTVLRSCTLRLRPCDGRCHPLQAILGPFTTTVESEANVGLRNLVLISTQEDNGCWLCQEAIAALVTRNMTLEKLEVGDHVFPNRGKSHFDRVGIMARAVGCNPTLKEIRFQCSVAELKELVLRLVPNADGRQANTTLSALKLSLINGETVLDCLTDVARLVESNTTLKHVQVSHDGWSLPESPVPRSSHLWKHISKVERQNREEIQGVTALESRLRGELERIRTNELQRNASLESLRVGFWKLIRVGDGHEWQMTYEGPCLQPRREYVVEVKMRGGVEHFEQPSWTSVSAYPTPSRTVNNTTAGAHCRTRPSTARGNTSGAADYMVILTEGGGDGGGG
ncbi:hypothetical protein M758_9G115000 [Ceratodon purpureus]|nr:hypothetical protein M758_9G114600 [Ceratodon purpureus]KAG0606110.1 hypothetical protein M758_9G114600 [Ceratodon purpureus]KAG0606115.1 hypothetical protein M758_9G115000 [Ceratodon purpureus]